MSVKSSLSMRPRDWPSSCIGFGTRRSYSSWSVVSCTPSQTSATLMRSIESARQHQRPRRGEGGAAVLENILMGNCLWQSVCGFTTCQECDCT
eukprot:4099332-Pleurochrysis_carterae.AAC.2